MIRIQYYYFHNLFFYNNKKKTNSYKYYEGNRFFSTNITNEYNNFITTSGKTLRLRFKTIQSLPTISRSENSKTPHHSDSNSRTSSLQFVSEISQFFKLEINYISRQYHLIASTRERSYYCLIPYIFSNEWALARY